MKALLLFDIDGTLVDTEGAGLLSLEEGLFGAFPEHRGSRPFPPLDLAGATDGSVVAFLFEHFEIEDHSGSREAFFESYSACLDHCMGQYRAMGKGQALLGVAELLTILSARPQDFDLGLLTGNTEQGARIKLRHFALDTHFTFGAFGDDHHDRNQLGPIALERAREQTGRSFSPDTVVIIGDTVKDIACARAFGARVLAVASGSVSRKTLEAARPDAILDDLGNLTEVLEVIDGLLGTNP